MWSLRTGLKGLDPLPRAHTDALSGAHTRIRKHGAEDELGRTRSGMRDKAQSASSSLLLPLQLLPERCECACVVLCG